MSIKTHKIVNEEESEVKYDTRRDYFEEVKPKERYITARLKEWILDYATDTSYRKSEERVNKMRQQGKTSSPGYGMKATTIRNIVEREGKALGEHIEKQTEEALEANGFTIEGRIETKTPVKTTEQHTIKEEEVNAAAAEIGLRGEVKVTDYEDPNRTVNISADDVCVKRQATERPNSAEKGKRKQVYNTVIQVNQRVKSTNPNAEENGGTTTGNYIINGDSQRKTLVMLMGFLLSNGLLWINNLVFFIDGEIALREFIEGMFGFLPIKIKIILDWYHLDKKLKERLSMSMAGYKLRNAFLEKLRPLLWNGNVKAAIELIKSLPQNQIKSYEQIDKLIEYLERNQPYIPCYALRAKLGLCNSSNRGEKANDLVVSSRQKHNGTSWSYEGSRSLANICAADRNGELSQWANKRSVNFNLKFFLNNDDINVAA